MLTLLLKDLLTLRRSLVTYALFIVLYGFIGMVTDNAGFYTVLVVLMGTMLPLSALSYDERAHWDRIGHCLPVPRTARILCKYLLSLVGIAGALLPALIIMLLRSPEIGTLLCLMCSMALLLAAVQLPILFWLGAERGRFISTALILLIGFGLPVLANLKLSVAAHLANGMRVLLEHCGWMLLCASVLFAVSAAASALLFRQQEIA